MVRSPEEVPGHPSEMKDRNGSKTRESESLEYFEVKTTANSGEYTTTIEQHLITRIRCVFLPSFIPSGKVNAIGARGKVRKLPSELRFAMIP